MCQGSRQLPVRTPLSYQILLTADKISTRHSQSINCKEELPSSRHCAWCLEKHHVLHTHDYCLCTLMTTNSLCTLMTTIFAHSWLLTLFGVWNIVNIERWQLWFLQYVLPRSSVWSRLIGLNLATGSWPQFHDTLVSQEAVPASGHGNLQLNEEWRQLQHKGVAPKSTWSPEGLVGHYYTLRWEVTFML